jgi:hypothetical protein
MITQYLCTCTRSERFAAAHRKESAKDAAIRADEREKMPTGPWVEGDTPAASGWYLYQYDEDGYNTDFYEDRVGWVMDHTVLRHARINTKGEGGE